MKLSSHCCIALVAAATLSSFSDGFAFQATSKQSSTALFSTWADNLSPVTLGVNGIAPATLSNVDWAASASTGSTTRHPIVAGNWKLNPTTKAEALDLLNGLKAGGQAEAEVVIFPPLPYLSDALSILEGTGIKIGAQNAGSNEKGAFTGEIAPSMLASAGCSYVLLGHSERRSLFGENDTEINKSLNACLDVPDLKVVLCVGETLEEYEAGLLNSIVDTQLRKGLNGVSSADLLDGRVVIAYEPVWAIGTGLVATPDQAQTAHEAIRNTLSMIYPNTDVSTSMRIQYGGSVSPDSVADLMAMPDVDGALVGGASLIADSFTQIIQRSTPGPAASAPSSPVSVPSAATNAAGFYHAPISYFAIDKLTVKGPRNGADVGQPYDATRPLDSNGAMSSGSWWCKDGGWPSPALRPTTEVFYVLEGRGCVTSLDGTRNFFGPGDLVILPKGWSGRWDVLEDIHKIWTVTDHPDIAGASTDPIIKQYSDTAPHNLMAQGVRQGATRGSPEEASQTYLDNGFVSVGCATTSPGSFPVSELTSSEAFFLLEGILFLTNDDGTSMRCGPGDMVVLPKGWKGNWDVLETIKRFTIVE